MERICSIEVCIFMSRINDLYSTHDATAIRTNSRAIGDDSGALAPVCRAPHCRCHRWPAAIRPETAGFCLLFFLLVLPDGGINRDRVLQLTAHPESAPSSSR